MEAMEASSVEAAVLWLAQTILANLLVGKLDSWLRQVELDDDIQKLRVEIERVEMVVSAGRGRAIGNRPLARSLARLKELLYDADDVVDELDYYRLKHQVEEVTLACPVEPESTNEDGGEQVDQSMPNANAGMPSSSDLKLRSEAWKDFRIAEVIDGKPVKAVCIHCATTVRCETSKGTSVLRNHIKSASCKRKRPATEQTANPASSIGGTDSISRKRARADEELTHNTLANARPWDKVGFSNTIQQIAHQLQDIRLELNEFHNFPSANSNHHQNTTSYPRLRTSSFIPRKVYGRQTEKDYIIRVMRAGESHTLTVLPIVGIGGVGKTALAQLVYDDPTVKAQYERVWAWVSDDFDEVIVTRHMLDFFSQESYQRISNYAKLQEILKGHMEHRSKRFLLILDDVWSSMDYYRWNELLAPLRSCSTKGNVIIVTTRNLFLAERIGTVKPMKLGALEEYEVWPIVKAFAFGDDEHKGNQTLETIGEQIAVKLKGSPLAAETAGSILREHLTVDHWSNVLKNEHWKSLQHSRGIMSSLKLSYDQLSYESQQCFSYCSIFPYKYKFLAEDLIHIWISLGFVRFNNSSKTDVTGRGYLTELVGSGFFEQVNTEGSQLCVTIPTLMHDFARLVSRTECAVIDGTECTELLPSIRHLSILTDSIQASERFKEKLRSVVNSARKMRTLLLIGNCNHSFLQSCQHIFRETKCLRMFQISLKISLTDASFDFRAHLTSSTHLRYLRVETKRNGEALHIPLSKFYHLEVLDAGSAAICKDMNGLVNMRRLVVRKGPASITGIDETGHPRESNNLTDQHSGCFGIRQLQSMNRLVHLSVFQLRNVRGIEVDGANVLTNKEHLEKLHLSWQDTNNSPSFEHFTDIAKDVLENLKPQHNLKHLRISWYNGAASPSWFPTAVTNLHTLHLENCRAWETLSLEILPLLTKLNLSDMSEVVRVLVPSVEELVLLNMPKLELLSCNSVTDLSSSLRLLRILNCRVLKSFPLFESCEKFDIEQKSWLSSLDRLIIHDCYKLKISNNLPPSSNVSEISINGVFEVPEMRGSSDKSLRIGIGPFHLSSSEKVAVLDDKSFAYHNLRMLTNLSICYQNRVYISFQGFRQLINLKYLNIQSCKEVFSSHDVQDPTGEYMAAANASALPSLRSLEVTRCEKVGKWLSGLLRHVQAVEEFDIYGCDQITALSIEEDESNLSDLSSGPEASSSGKPYSMLARPASDGLLHMPSNIISSVKKMSIGHCDQLTYQGSKVAFAGFTSLEDLSFQECPKLIPSLVHSGENDDSANGIWFLPLSLRNICITCSPETLQLCFPENGSCLKCLRVLSSPRLKSLQLHSCTALEMLKIDSCESLAALEGLQSLGGLRVLKVRSCPLLPPSLEHLSRQGYKLCSGLECLKIGELSFLSAPLCMHLTSLKCLKIGGGEEEVTRLTNEQERALQHLTSLRELRLNCGKYRGLPVGLHGLPVGLHTLPSLRTLEIRDCLYIKRLPEQGLPPSLEELYIIGCSEELTEQCRILATTHNLRLYSRRAKHYSSIVHIVELETGYEMDG